MERFEDSLKTWRALRFQKLVAILENRLFTSLPMERIALNAAIETKKAIIAYSIAVAPPRSSIVRWSAERISKPVPTPICTHDGQARLDES
jgi:hypothetical protein